MQLHVEVPNPQHNSKAHVAVQLDRMEPTELCLKLKQLGPKVSVLHIYWRAGK